MNQTTTPATFESLPDLASRTLGGSVVLANDELFANRENLILPGPPGHTLEEFGPKGKTYDGWETRRRREPGNDHAIVRLGVPGSIGGVVVDTSWFTGNYPPEISVEGVDATGYPSAAEVAALPWTSLVPRSPARGDTTNRYPVRDARRFTHVRLSIYPDGGVARLRVHGRPVPDPLLLTGTIDLAALENGGSVVECSNMHYSSPGNILLPDRPRTMGEGWETARRRGPGNDHVVVRLAGLGRVRRVEVDTTYFVGNAPGEIRLLGGDGGPSGWAELLSRRPVQPDTRHHFPVDCDREISHVRLDVYPDGGIARLRIHGDLGRPTIPEEAR